MTPAEIAQQLLDGPWMHAAAARRACQQGRWLEFARERAPRRPLLLGRLDYARCLELAERSLSGPVTEQLTLVPLWGCQTFETTSTQWAAVHGVAAEAQPFDVLEVSPFLDDASPRADALWICSVRRWTAPIIVRSADYGASIALKLRAGAFAVSELRIFEVLSVDVHETEPLPRPTREVVIFACWFEPRVSVSPELQAQIRALCHTAPGDRKGLP